MCFFIHVQTAPKIFGGKIMSHLLIFVGKTSDNAEEVLTNVKESAKKFKGKVCDLLCKLYPYFLHINLCTEFHNYIL